MVEKRVVLEIRGIVQGAGYRNLVSMIAHELKIKGEVWNDAKDRHLVHAACEGSEAALNEFVKKIDIKKFPVGVESIEARWEPSKREYSYFDVRRGNPVKETAERADEGALYVMLLRDEMEKMRLETGTRFDSMEGRYGAIAQLIKGFQQEIREDRKVFKSIAESINQSNKLMLRLAEKIAFKNK